MGERGDVPGSSLSPRRSINGPSPSFGAETSVRRCIIEVVDGLGVVATEESILLLRGEDVFLSTTPARWYAILDSMVVCCVCVLR